MDLVTIIQESSGKELLFERVNQNESELISITPADNEGNGRIGAPILPLPSLSAGVMEMSSLSF